MWPKEDLKDSKCEKCKEKSEHSDSLFHFCFLCDFALCSDHFNPTTTSNIDSWSVVNFDDLSTFTVRPKEPLEPEEPSPEASVLDNSEFSSESPRNPPPYNSSFAPFLNPQTSSSPSDYNPPFNPNTYTTSQNPLKHKGV
jgi:hypothetical protein